MGQGDRKEDYFGKKNWDGGVVGWFAVDWGERDFLRFVEIKW